jgi:hypothetical protein
MRRLICAVASMPFMPGIDRSIRIRSGVSEIACRTASLPSRPSPTTSKSGSELTSDRRPWRSRL